MSARIGTAAISDAPLRVPVEAANDPDFAPVIWSLHVSFYRGDATALAAKKILETLPHISFRFDGDNIRIFSAPSADDLLAVAKIIKECERFEPQH